jgi:hypothetical protein
MIHLVKTGSGCDSRAPCYLTLRDSQNNFSEGVISKPGMLQVAFLSLSVTPRLQPGDHADPLQPENRFNGLLFRYGSEKAIGKPLKRFKDC